VRLDDEPIETATVVRFSADNGALQADLIVGPDGRAHAIRIVSNR
jgi:2-polyprenyl-6-methoxyphenol hydroxylase-like FAD-dependent oxidoreductase